MREVIDDTGARAIIYMGGDGTFAEVAKRACSRRSMPATCADGAVADGDRQRSGQVVPGSEAGPAALARNVEVVAAGETVGCDVGRLVIERGPREVHRDLFFDSFSIGLGAASLQTRNRDRERVGRIPGLGMIYRDMMVYTGAVLQRFVESYVVDIKFDLEAVIDGRVEQLDGLLDVIVKNTATHLRRRMGARSRRRIRADGVFELVPIFGRRDLTTKLLATFRHSPLDLEQVGIVHDAPMPGARLQSSNT